MDQDQQHPSPAPLVEDDAPRRPYSAPRLSVHGTVAQLTAAITQSDAPGGSVLAPG